MSVNSTFDVAIIGGGHNGLTTAAYLAREGLSVVVAEKNRICGGAALTEEFAPGFKNSVASYTVSLLNPKVIKDLQLSHFGLRIVERPVANFWPIDDARSLILPYGLAERQKAIAQFSKSDAERLPAYDAALERAANVLRDLVLRVPPNVGGGYLELLKAAGIGRRFIGLDLEDERLIFDLFTMSVSDFLSQWFENDIVKGAFAFDGIVGAYAAPSTPGTAYVLLHHCFGEVNGKTGVWGHALGGMGAISQAIAASAKAAGAEIRTGAGVREVIIKNRRAVGLWLANGDRINAKVVVSNVGPKLLFRDLVPDDAIEPETRKRFLNTKTGSGTFRMNVALTELPDFKCRPGRTVQPHHSSGIVFGPTMDYLEQAYLDARQNGWSKAPIIEMLIPSTLDPGLAPKGKHVASLFVQHVAPQLPGQRSWKNEKEKETFADLVVKTIDRYAPNFANSIIARQILSPLDLEQRFGMIDGDIFHGQLLLNQLFSARPVLGHADYRMPVPGLYLCGAGAHPGGGVTGLPGRNAASQIIRDLRSVFKRRR